MLPWPEKNPQRGTGMLSKQPRLNTGMPKVFSGQGTVLPHVNPKGVGSIYKNHTFLLRIIMFKWRDGPCSWEERLSNVKTLISPKLNKKSNIILIIILLGFFFF